MASTIPSAISWSASSAQSHWERLRPSVSGRSQARRTTWIATSGGKTALGTTAGGVSEAVQALDEKPLGPLADDSPLHTSRPPHIGLGVPSGQQQDDFPPACPPCSDGGRPLPPFQG